MTKKEEVLACVQWLITTVPDKRETGATTQEIAEKMQMQRSNISTLLNELVQEGKLEKLSGRPVCYRPCNLPHTVQKETSCFKVLAGCEGCLKPMIQLAKAAILYPEHSLNTLIVGAAGVGKTTFAYLMYQFAQENDVIAQQAPFERFSCHLSEGQEKEVGQRLFGPDGAMQHAAGGMLFIDSVDNLSSSLRERLLDMIDSDGQELQKVVLICSASEKARPVILDSLTAHFSARVELPSLQAHSIAERFALVRQFLTDEAVRMKRGIRVNAELLHSLCLYRCENNIKQLRNDIRLGCANAYVHAFNSAEKELILYLNDFPSGVSHGLLYYKKYRDELEAQIPQEYVYTFSEDTMRKENLRETSLPEIGHQMLNASVYDTIDRKAEELRGRGIGDEDIGHIINAELEYDMKQFANRITQSKVSRESLCKVMDRRIVDMVDAMLKEAAARFNKVYPETTFYGLCLHLSSTIERGASSRHNLSNERILDVVEKCREEYALCMRFASAIEQEFDIRLSIDEAVFMTMFLCDPSLYRKSENGPVVLVAMHGDSTASSMVDVVNSLAGCGNAYAYDMPLDKDMQQAYDELKAAVQELNRGQGILLVYDMGSLRTMAEIITKETGVPIRTVALPGTLIAVDCARKANSCSSLDELQEGAMESCRDFYTQIAEPSGRAHRSKVIITLCMTGEGGAVQMKHFLEKNAAMNDTDIIPLAVDDRKALLTEINHLKENHEIVCVVGTYDPGLYNIPFISVVQLFETPVDKLDILLTMPEEERTKVNYEMIYAYLAEQMPGFDVKKLRRCLPKAMAQLKKAVQGLTQDQELGLFLHISCAVERIRKGENMPEKTNRQAIISRNKRLYNDLHDILWGVEDTFGIQFSDDELAYIIGIVKKL